MCTRRPSFADSGVHTGPSLEPVEQCVGCVVATLKVLSPLVTDKSARDPLVAGGRSANGFRVSACTGNHKRLCLLRQASIVGLRRCGATGPGERRPNAIARCGGQPTPVRAGYVRRITRPGVLRADQDGGDGAVTAETARSAPRSHLRCPCYPAGTMTAPSPPPGWYADPSGAPGQRYFHGSEWTEHRADPPERLPVSGSATATRGGTSPVRVATTGKYDNFSLLFARECWLHVRCEMCACAAAFVSDCRPAMWL